MSRCTDVDSRARPASVDLPDGGAPLQLVVVVGAVLTLLRWMFSDRVRKEFDVAADQLEAALSEVDARLARTEAARSGHRVRLRHVPLSSSRDVVTDRKGRSHADSDDAGLKGKQ